MIFCILNKLMVEKNVFFFLLWIGPLGLLHYHNVWESKSDFHLHADILWLFDDEKCSFQKIAFYKMWWPQSSQQWKPPMTITRHWLLTVGQNRFTIYVVSMRFKLMKEEQVTHITVMLVRRSLYQTLSN